MADLSKETITYLSGLSRIHCTEEEAEKLLEDLQQIVDYIEQLQELDCSDVPPTSHAIAGVSNVMRDDEVEEALPRKTFLDNAPDHVGGMIRVPPVLSSDPT